MRPGDLRSAVADCLRDLVALLLTEPARREHLDCGKVPVEDPDQAPRLGRCPTDPLDRLIHLDRVLNHVRLEPVHSEPDGLLAVPEHRVLLQLRVREPLELDENAAVDLEQGSAHGGDIAKERLRRAVLVLIAPRVPSLIGFVGIAWPVRGEPVLDHAKEAVLRPEHVCDHLA
jgi:hypothetical protein